MSSDEMQILKPLMPNTENLIQYLKKIDENGIYSNYGPLNLDLENRLSKYFNIKAESISTCVNATQALMGLVETSDISKREFWYLPSWTFSATAAAILNMHKKATFVDIDSSSWRAVFPKKSRIILDVLPFGDEIEYENYDNKELIIIDAAASFDSLKQIDLTKFKQKVAVVVSFHATKIMGMGEGACVISNDPDWIYAFRRWTNFGFDEKRVTITKGSNAKMSEYTAAVGLSALDIWPQSLEIWQKITDEAIKISYLNGFEVSPAMKKRFISPYWILRLKSHEHQKNLEKLLVQNKIDSRYWWQQGCHNFQPYKRFYRNALPNTENEAKRNIAIPFHPHMVKEDFERISQVLTKYNN